jgi:ubiquitin-protein ligase
MHPYPSESVDARDGAPARTALQLARLESEWRQLRRAFAYHAAVQVVPLGGEPPSEYQVNYQVTTLAIDDAGQLAYVNGCSVHVWLPPQFPHNAPVVRPLANLFHPNVALEWVHLNPPWQPDSSLVDVVAQVGFLLAYQSYDPAAVANPVAMNWVFANPHLLPTDPGASFSPAAGGPPLSRITRFGPDTLRDLQHRVDAAVDRLVAAEPAPPAEEPESISRDVRAALPLLLDPDVPEVLRRTAAELRELAESLTAPDSVWSRFGRQLVLSKSIAAAADEVVKAEEAVRRAMATGSTEPIRAPAASAPPADARPEAAPAAAPPAVARVPAAPVIQPVVLTLRKAVRDADRAVSELRARLAQLAASPRPPAAASSPEALLSRRLSRELSRVAAATEPARAAGAWLASLEPILHRARREAAAAERVAAWAEHLDLLRRGRELAARLRATPATDLQSYRVAGPSGAAGPFEFEQRVHPPDGGPPLAVWNVRASLVRVVDVETEEVVARGDGRVTVARPAATGASEAATATVTVADHTDELRVQLEYLLTRSRDALSRLRPPEEEPPPAVPPSGWAGRLAADLDLPDAQSYAEEQHRQAADEWKHLLADLASLGRFKQRLATVHLLERLIDFAPRVHAGREATRTAVARADARLAEIGARSARDLESDRLIIPEHLAAEYAQHLSAREDAQSQSQRLQLALDAAVERLKLRLTKPRFFGSAELPRPHLLPPPPESYTQYHPELTDERVSQLVRRLESLLSTTLAPAAGPHAAETKPAPPPAEESREPPRPTRPTEAMAPPRPASPDAVG